ELCPPRPSEPCSRRPSKLGVHTEAKNIDWSTDSIVGGVDHMLIVEGEVQAFDYRCFVIDLQDSLEPVAGQLTIADQHTEPTGGEIAASLRRDGVDDTGEAKRIVWAMPTIALQRYPGRNRLVDLGELVDFLAAVVCTYSCK